VQEESQLEEGESESVLRDMFSDWKNGGVDTLFGKGKLGSKSLTQFIKKKDIAPEIRALMGEHQDPFVNYTKSISKTSRFIADQRFLGDVREEGIGKWLFEEGRNPPGFNTQIAADESRVMSPLNGLRTTEPIAKVFNDFNKSEMSTAVINKMYHALNTMSKMSKTVFSVKTQGRNLFGQTGFFLLNGHAPTTGLIDALKAVGANLDLTTDAGSRSFQKKLAELGLMNESAFSGELKDSINDFSKNLTEQDSPFDYSAWTMAKKLAISTPMKAYQLSDQFGKAIGFANELGRAKRRMPDAPLQVQEQEAAARVRNTYPTYSNVPEWMKAFRKVPLIGPFVSFAYESFRTTAHAANYMRQDFASGNFKDGSERAVGMLAALGGASYGLQKLSQQLSGVSDEEDKDLRRFLPDWSKNSFLFYRDKSDGKLEFVDLSYANPYSYILDPVLAGMTELRDDKGILDASTKAFGEMLTPWTNEQMLAGAIVDVVRNKTQDGREVYNPEDVLEVKWQKRIGHILEAVEPGTANRLRKKLIPALRDDGSVDYTPMGVVLGEVTGFDVQRVDFLKSASFRAGAFSRGLRDTSRIFSKGLGKRGFTGSVMEQYQNSERSRWKLFNEAHKDVQALRRRGINDRAIGRMMLDAGIGKGDMAAVMKGKYKPLVPSKQVLVKAAKAGNILSIDLLQEIKDLARERSTYVLVD